MSLFYLFAALLFATCARASWWQSATGAFLDTHKCTDLYVDIGSNVGVQVRKLFEPEKYTGAPFTQFFDTHFGSVERRRRQVCAIGFEPNPRKTATLTRIEQRYIALGWRVWFMTETLFGTAFRRTAFFSDNDTANEEWGASIYDHTGKNAKFIVQEVDGVAFFAHFARQVRHRGGVVVTKMDIEASEFGVLPHLLSNHILCQSVVVAMLIEWHVRLLPPEIRPRAEIIQSAMTIFVQSQVCNGTLLLDFDDETYLHDGAPLP